VGLDKAQVATGAVVGQWVSKCVEGNANL